MRIESNIKEFNFDVSTNTGYTKVLSEAEVAVRLIESRNLSLISLRNNRNAFLQASDWTQLVDAPVNKAVWAEYRQALRDLPATIDDPLLPVEWPIIPVN